MDNIKDPQEESFNASPEVYITDTTPKPHDHYFTRKNNKEFTCRNCTAHWIDNGAFQFEAGKFLKYEPRF